MVVLYILAGIVLVFLLITGMPVTFRYTRRAGRNRWSLWGLGFRTGSEGASLFGIRLGKSRVGKKKLDAEQPYKIKNKDKKKAEKSEKELKKQDEKSDKKKDSSDFGLREFLILYDEKELVFNALKAVLRFFIRLFKAFRFRFKGFCLHFGCPDPACVGMLQCWLFSMNIPHRAYYFSWELDAEGEVRIRIVPLAILFLILRLIFEIRPIRLYKLYRITKIKGGKDGKRDSGNPEDAPRRDQGNSPD